MVTSPVCHVIYLHGYPYMESVTSLSADCKIHLKSRDEEFQ